MDCDCDGSPAEPDMHDMGILASYDPVALDQACVDLVYAAADGVSLINRIEVETDYIRWSTLKLLDWAAELMNWCALILD